MSTKKNKVYYLCTTNDPAFGIAMLQNRHTKVWNTRNPDWKAMCYGFVDNLIGTNFVYRHSQDLLDLFEAARKSLHLNMLREPTRSSRQRRTQPPRPKRGG